MSYICNKCGASLDAGERCKCGGQAMYINRYRSRGAVRRYDALPQTPSKRRLVYQIFKKTAEDPTEICESFDEALDKCQPDEYIRTVMVLSN